MNGSSFEPMIDHFGRICYGCVPDSVSLRFEFSFMNGSSFEPILESFWRFEFSFMNGSRFELCLDHFW